MAKPILRFKVNQQSAEVGGKFYGIIEDTPVTPENSILQICEFKKITAFTPEQVLRLVEDVCDGAAKLVARDGLSRQLSSLLKFSPRVRGTFNAVDSRWGDQKLIVGARLLKDIKLDMNPGDFVMSNVADVGILQSAAWATLPWGGETPYGNTALDEGDDLICRVNGSKLDLWDHENTFAKVAAIVGGEVRDTEQVFAIEDVAANGFSVTLRPDGGTTLGTLFDVGSGTAIDGFQLRIFHPASDVEFKRFTLPATAIA